MEYQAIIQKEYTRQLKLFIPRFILCAGAFAAGDVLARKIMETLNKKVLVLDDTSIPSLS